jgi:hypothetical protein
LKTRDSYKVKIKVGDATVEVQGAEKGVVKIVEALSDVLRGVHKASTSTRVAASLPPPISSPPARTSPVDIRAFFQEKAPSSDVEATAVVAYYHKYLAPTDQRRETIDADTLQEAFRLAKWPLPSRTTYTLVNARNAGYLDSAGEGGQYLLNPVGFNLVEHTLGRVQPAEKPRKIRKPKRKKPKGKKPRGR